MSLATSISSTFYAVTAIGYLINKENENLFLGDLFKFIIKTAIAAIFMGSILFFMNIFIPIDFSADFTMKGKIIVT